MQKASAGAFAFDSDATQKFDADDKNNIAFYLNNEYLNNSELKNYIENNHEWDIERGADDGNCNSAYKVNAAVALLSYSEWITYKNIIGSKDTQSWWLRTPRGINAEESDGFVVNDDGGKAIIARSTNKTAEVRPVFYVSRDFIKDVKIDTEKTGQRVKNLILKYFTASELYKSGYTVSEIEQLGYETEAKITSASLSGGTQTGYPLTLSYESVGICSDIKITWQYASMKNGNYTALTRDSVLDSDINTYTIKPEDRRKYVKCIITPVNADVDSGLSYYNTLTAARAAGFINGDNNNMFYPDDLLTYNDAAAILVNALGGGSLVAANGGYPNGYMKIASGIGLLKGVKVSDAENLIRSEAAKLLVNELDCEVFMPSFEANGMSYEGREKLLYKYRKIVKSTGVMETTQYKSLAQPYSDTRSNVVISRDSYDCDFNADLCLGRKVKFYYDENEMSLTYVTPAENDSVITINATEIDEIDDRTITYFTNENHTSRKKITIPWDVKVIYNRRARPDYTMQNFDIISGTIVIADSANGKNDIAYITEYKAVLVENINTDELIITDKYNTSDNLELDDGHTDNVTIYNYTDDKPASFADIAKGDVLSAAISEDGRLVSIYIVRDTMEGEISAVTETTPHYIIETPIGEYKVHNKQQLTSLLTVNKYGRFYLDMYGCVAGFDLIESSGYNYVFLIESAIRDGDDGIEAKIKYFDMLGKIETVV